MTDLLERGAERGRRRRLVGLEQDVGLALEQLAHGAVPVHVGSALEQRELHAATIARRDHTTILPRRLPGEEHVVGEAALTIEARGPVYGFDDGGGGDDHAV